MITFLDENDIEYGALATLRTTNAVNGERSISGEIISGDYVLSHIERGWRLRFEDEYYVVTYAKPKDAGKQISVSFDAVHQFFWDFDKSSVHRQLKDGSHTFVSYLDFIFEDTGYRYTVDPLLKIPAFSKQSFGYKKRLTLFNDIVKSTGVEFSVSGKVVRILVKAGTDLSTVVRKNFNLNELGIEKNIGDFVTYQKGFGAWNDSEDHSKGRLEVEYESPLATVYGRLEAEPLVDERYTDRNSMLSALKETVDNSYSVSVKIDMEDLTKAGYDYTQPRAGDYIMAINETLGFREKIRIVSYVSEYDVKGTLVKHEVTCNDIGAVKKQSAGYSTAKKQMASTAENIDKALEVAHKAMVTADGKNTAYFGNTMPVDEPKGTLKKGDMLYLQVGEDTKMYFWNGADWEEPPVVNDVKEFNRKLTQVENQIETIAQTNQESAQKAQDALDEAGAVKDLAAEAKRISDESKQTAQSALNKAKDIFVGDRNLLEDTEKMSDQNPKLNPNGSLATMFGRAIKRAEVPAGSSTIAEGYRKSLTVALYGDKELIVSFYAKAQARGQVIRCQLLDNRNIIKVAETSTGHTNEASDGLVEFPVTNGWLRYWIRYTFKQPCYDKPTVILGSLGGTSASTERWAEINSPAAYYGHHNKEWSPSDADIKTEFTLFKNETNELIEQRLTKTEFEDFVDKKGYVAGTVFDNYKRETAQSIERQMTETRALIPTKIGGRNLLLNSSFMSDTKHWALQGNAEKVDDYHRFTLEKGITKHIRQSIFDKVKNDPEEQVYTYSLDVKIDNLSKGTTNPYIAIIIDGHRNDKWYGATFLSRDNLESYSEQGWQRLSGRFKLPAREGMTSCMFYIFARDCTGVLSFRRVQLERGSISTDYHPAPEDMVSTLDFQSVKETAQLYERIIGSTEDDVATKISRMALTSELFRSEIERKQSDSELIARMSDGIPHIPNPDFKADLTGYNIYDNRSSGHVSLTRVVDGLSLSGYALELKTSNAGTSPGFGGFYNTSRSAKNKEFIIRMVANIPQGRRIEHRTNNIGIGAITRWLTSDIGTGQYETYIAYVKSGHSGTFSTFGHWNLADGPDPSPDNPLVWRVSSYQIYDISSSNASAVKTQMDQLSDSWAVKTLNSRGDVLSQINLAAGATSIEVGKNKLVVTPETTYIQNGTIKSAMIANAQIGTAHIGEIDASIARIINLDVSRITGLDADFIKAKIGNAIVEWLQGKRISATNGALEIDLNAGQINTYIDKAAIRRIASGRPTQFIKFQNHGNTSSRTTIGSNRSGTEIDTDGAFSGIRIVNGNLPSGQRSWLGTTSEDYVQAIGDHIDFTHSLIDGRGWRMITHQDNKPEVTLEPYRWSDARVHNIYANNFYFRKADKGSSISLLDVIRELSLIASHIKNGGFSSDAQRSISLIADKIATFKIV